VHQNYDGLYDIGYLVVGEGPDMLGGPATSEGWYVHPPCMVGCCASLGPYQTLELAIVTARKLEEKVMKGLSSQRPEPIGPF